MKEARSTAARRSVSTEELIAGWLGKGYSLAWWRLPGERKSHIIFSDSPRLAQEINLEESEPGFIFSPFDLEKEKIFFPSDNHFIADQDKIEKVRGAEISLDPPGKLLMDAFFRSRSSTIKDDLPVFQGLVGKCLMAISRGDFEKIVPSRTKEIHLAEDSNPVISFELLCHAFPDALVSMVSSPLTGTWLGASPELLVSTSKVNIFHTVALAGTQAHQPGIDLKAIAWTQKDIEEQALVSRYIINCFKKIRLREFEEHGPKTIQAGNLIHLKTDFSVDMTATGFPQLGSVMLKLLHPTSAVCGMPLDSSLKFLQSEEHYDREFYSGYLGPVQIENETHIYVNLRCMQLKDNSGILYAGAGVTIDSDPEREWMETEMKMETLGKIILGN